MKHITILLFSIFLISCNQNVQAQKDNAPNSDSIFATDLIDHDFLKYADSSMIDGLKTQLKNTFDIYNDDNFKITHVDAEELAEFSFDFFIPNLNRLLEKRQANLSVKKLNANDNSFDIIINQDTIQLYSQKELDDGLFWETAPRNFFKKVNEILKNQKIDEQFYLLYGGNDLLTLLLTEKQFLIISEYYKNNDKEKPYRP